jgi:hypothetical protein
MGESRRSQTLRGPAVGGQEEKKSKGVSEHKILVLGLCVTYWLLFFCNLHKFQNIDKTFLQEFSFIAWLA